MNIKYASWPANFITYFWIVASRSYTDYEPTSNVPSSSLNLALSKLSPRVERLIRLHYQDGMKLEELARLDNTSPSWVSYEIQRGVHQLVRMADVRRLMSRTPEVEAPVSEFEGLSRYTRNILAKAGITTVGQLPKSKKKLMRINGIGKNSVAEIMGMMPEVEEKKPAPADISGLGLPARAVNGLMKAGIRTVDAVPRTVEALTQLDGIGVGTAERILAALGGDDE